MTSLPAVYEYRLVSSPPLNLWYLFYHIHYTPQVGTLPIWCPAGDVELGHSVGLVCLYQEWSVWYLWLTFQNHSHNIYTSYWGNLDSHTANVAYLFVHDTECPDGESLQSLLTHQVHSVLPKHSQLTNSSWPVLVTALLWISFQFTEGLLQPCHNIGVSTIFGIGQTPHAHFTNKCTHESSLHYTTDVIQIRIQFVCR
jgi:hypothetical protein